MGEWFNQSRQVYVIVFVSNILSTSTSADYKEFTLDIEYKLYHLSQWTKAGYLESVTRTTEISFARLPQLF